MKSFQPTLSFSIASTAALLLSQVSSVHAQVAGLSTQCQSAATGLISTPFASCANVAGLVSVITATGSIVTPVNTWIGGVCSSAPCSQSDIDTAQSSVQSGCATDIANAVPAALALDVLVSNYTSVRDIVCLQATSNSTFCLTNFLNAYQTATGTQLTVSDLSGLLSASGLESALANVPASDVCTDCNHAIFSEAAPLVSSASSSAASSLTSAASTECGASFIDGQTPSTVQEATTSSSSSSSSGNPNVSSTSLSGASTLGINFGVVAAVGVVLGSGVLAGLGVVGGF